MMKHWDTKTNTPRPVLADFAPVTDVLGESANRLTDEIAKKREASIRGQIGLTFRQRVEVTIRKPRWMPDRLYRYLMRTIVVAETFGNYEVHR